MRLSVLFLGILFTVNSTVSAQRFITSSDTLNRNRILGTSLGCGLTWAGSTAALHFVWYKDFEKSNFHFFNDFHEWQQMDKAGHFYTSYQITKLTDNLYRWSGVNHKKAALIGSGFSLGYLTTLEVLDAYNEKWGFSWADMAFNTIGTALYSSQALIWDKQYIRPKFSVHNSNLAPYRPSLLGNNFSTRLLKDYNGQTYWLSFNPFDWSSTTRNWPIPKWINLSFGYSINNQLSGNGETYIISIPEEQLSFTPYRQYFLSLDVDFEAIPTRSKWLKIIFKGLNTIKVPFPALEFSQNQVKFRPLYF